MKPFLRLDMYRITERSVPLFSCTDDVVCCVAGCSTDDVIVALYSMVLVVTRKRYAQFITLSTYNIREISASVNTIYYTKFGIKWQLVLAVFAINCGLCFKLIIGIEVMFRIVSEQYKYSYRSGVMIYFLLLVMSARACCISDWLNLLFRINSSTMLFVVSSLYCFLCCSAELIYCPTSFRDVDIMSFK